MAGRRSLTYLGLLLGELGRQDEALAHHLRAIALSLQTGVPQHTLTVLGNMARTLGDAGRLVESRPLYLQALQILRMHEAPPANAAITMTNLANVLLSAGHYAQALALLEEAGRLAGRHYAAGCRQHVRRRPSESAAPDGRTGGWADSGVAVVQCPTPPAVRWKEE